ncbi:MAG TPA: hypothetical protein PLM24_01315 [Methanothrix sp.]|nr:hypothetical protein [Methanothrix sp.]HPJ83155.1 hypothetical protein [Methanothrix sp.]HPR65756.1 hypothetical protein [Methanothrix sp.]
MLLAVVMVFLAFYPLITASPNVLSSAGDVEDSQQLMEILSSMTNIGLIMAIVLLGIERIYPSAPGHYIMIYTNISTNLFRKFYL